MEKHKEDKRLKDKRWKEKDEITNGVKGIEGEVRGIEKMVENERYCVDILVQI